MAQTEKKQKLVKNAKVAKSSVADKAKVNKIYSTGKRKNSIARVWIYHGSGEIKVNNKNFEVYFPRESNRRNIVQPFTVTDSLGQFSVFATVKGGGCSGQSGAIQHALAKALDRFSSDYRPSLKKAGLLTRDSRVVERKKYGQHKARKSTQFSKR